LHLLAHKGALHSISLEEIITLVDFREKNNNVAEGKGEGVLQRGRRVRYHERKNEGGDRARDGKGGEGK